MKKFELYAAIAVFVITTFLIIGLPLLFNYSNGLLGLVCFVSAGGYITAYLLLDGFLQRHETYHYFRGFDDRTIMQIKRDQRERDFIDLTKGKKPKFNLSKNNH
jgi:hypothetical protein